VSDRLAALVFALIGAGLSLPLRWIAFHPREFVLKCFPYYDQYYQPGRIALDCSKFFGLMGHIIFTSGAISCFISIFLPARFVGYAFVPSIVIAAFVWTKSLRGVLKSRQEDKSA
jgi:hypothetical protein